VTPVAALQGRLAASLRSGERRHVGRWAVALAALAFLVYVGNRRTIGSGDTIPARYLPHTILHEGDLDFNEFPELHGAGRPYFLRKIGDSYLSSYPPVAGFLALPVHAVAHLFPGADTPQGLEGQEKAAAALIAAASVAVVFLAARQVASGPAALLVALVYALCTSTLSTSSQALWQHGPGELFLALAALALLRRQQAGPLWGAGAALGLATLTRPTNAMAVVVLGLYVLLRRRRQLVPFVLGGLPCLALGLWYVAAYGSPFGAYGFLARQWAWAGSLGWGLAGHLVSPSRGLLVFSPVLAFAAHGFWRKVVRERDALFAGMAVFCLAQLLIVSKFTHWWGGHSLGPRLLTDIAPFLSLFLVPTAERLTAVHHRGLRWAFAGLAALSFAIHGAAAYDKAASAWNTSPDIDRYPARLWHWGDSQALAAFRKRPLAIPFESLDMGAGVPEGDPRATYGWCLRLDAAPAVVSFQVELRPMAYELSFRARVAPGAAGELVVARSDGEVLARLPLPPASAEFVTQRAAIGVPGGRRRVPVRVTVASGGGAAVWLDHTAFRERRQ